MSVLDRSPQRCITLETSTKYRAVVGSLKTYRFFINKREKYEEIIDYVGVGSCSNNRFR
jgi:hypothetical protein